MLGSIAHVVGHGFDCVVVVTDEDELYTVEVETLKFVIWYY